MIEVLVVACRINSYTLSLVKEEWCKDDAQSKIPTSGPTNAVNQGGRRWNGTNGQVAELVMRPHVIKVLSSSLGTVDG